MIQPILSVIILLLVLYWLYRQFKQLLTETVNGYTIHPLNQIYEVRKGKEAQAQFTMHKQAVAYCLTH